ncbi:hypothetical protein RC86_10240 [Pectobacterium brasiliense]|uniref:hypothetical protein n=1 Tax=Pectobacterium brasiliense TaxID=180957 RepID=UPI00057FBD0E|nr:hypothetical protein [Pectobacterium brasiliense]KHS91420.1 hypothetical protein RC86_10240 [Pectobacterium brasiliense]
MNDIIDIAIMEIDELVYQVSSAIPLLIEPDESACKDLKRLLQKTKASLYQFNNIIKKNSDKKVDIIRDKAGLSSHLHDFIGYTQRASEAHGREGVGYVENYLEILKRFKKIFDSYQRDAIDYLNDYKIHEGLNFNANGFMINEYIDDLKHTYANAKKLVDDIYNEYNSLETNLSKLNLQQEKIETLEINYRKALSKFTVGSEEYKNKLAELDVGHAKATEFLTMYQNVNTDLSDLRKEVSKTVSDVKTLTLFVQKHNDIYKKNNDDLSGLIATVKGIVGNATAAAVGQHFKIQYDRSKRYIILWPSLGALFLLSAIAICLLTVFPEIYVGIFGGEVSAHDFNDDNVPYIISRILVAPLFLVGAWFCASQYIKQKNIIEDYAYKKVLSLSLMSIKSEIEKTGEKNTSAFIKAVQKEILKSPLDSLDRKHVGKEMKLLGEVQSQILTNLADQLTNKDKKNEKKKVEG